MSRAADRAREDRWKAKGNQRLHVRITAHADDCLTLMCQANRMSRKEVIEALLTGQAIQAPWFVGERLSAEELRIAQGMPS